MNILDFFYNVHEFFCYNEYCDLKKNPNENTKPLHIPNFFAIVKPLPIP